MAKKDENYVRMDLLKAALQARADTDPKFTITGFAREVGVARKSIYNILTGRYIATSLPNLRAIARGLGLKVSHLVID